MAKILHLNPHGPTPSRLRQAIELERRSMQLLAAFAYPLAADSPEVAAVNAHARAVNEFHHLPCSNLGDAAIAALRAHDAILSVVDAPDWAASDADTGLLRGAMASLSAIKKCLQGHIGKTYGELGLLDSEMLPADDLDAAN